MIYTTGDVRIDPEARDKLQADMEGHRSRQKARDDGFAARSRYLADHDGDRLKIERIDELLGSRAQSAVPTP